MVTEVDDGTGQTTQQMAVGGQQPGGTAQLMPGTGQVMGAGATGVMGGPPQQSMRNISRDRWGDIYANMPVKRMVALYDYDPQELSPNVDAEVSPSKYLWCAFRC